MMPLALSRRSLESWGWFLLFCFTIRSLLWSDRTPINWLSSGAHLPPFSWVSLTLYCPQFWHKEELYKHMWSSKTKKNHSRKFKKTAGNPKHELSDASYCCMVGVVPYKVVARHRKLCGDQFSELVLWEPLWIEKEKKKKWGSGHWSWEKKMQTLERVWKKRRE